MVLPWKRITDVSARFKWNDNRQKEGEKRDAGMNYRDGDSADEVTIGPSEVIVCHIRLSSFLSLQHDSDKLTKKLASITQHLRKQCSLRKTQCTMDAFLINGYRLTLHSRE